MQRLIKYEWWSNVYVRDAKRHKVYCSPDILAPLPLDITILMRILTQLSWLCVCVSEERAVCKRMNFVSQWYPCIVFHPPTQQEETYKQHDGQHPRVCASACVTLPPPQQPGPPRLISLLVTHHHPTSSSFLISPTLFLPLHTLLLILSSISHLLCSFLFPIISFIILTSVTALFLLFLVFSSPPLPNLKCLLCLTVHRCLLSSLQLVLTEPGYCSSRLLGLNTSLLIRSCGVMISLDCKGHWITNVTQIYINH